jgi:predicted CoA-substrate-specific enzyme activase
MIFAGIDAGSRAIKLVLMDGERNILNTGVTDQGVAQAVLAGNLLDRSLEENGYTRNDVKAVVATGYGRDALEFANTAITEITCHARGVSHIMKDVSTIIDIGGQDSKVIRLEQSGLVRDFKMNDRCAAGTGRFLEVVAGRLDVEIFRIGRLVENAKNPSHISSMCVVFAETEIIGLLASGESRENILAGVQNSIASRIAAMAGRHIADPVIFTGGVALVPGMDRALEQSIGHPVQISDSPQFTGAIGAALLAIDRY